MSVLVLLFFGKLSAYEFIKGIILYNDKIEIYYNTDKKTLDDENRRALSFYCETCFYETETYRFCHEQILRNYPERQSLAVNLFV